jgi:hypothetical protein
MKDILGAVCSGLCIIHCLALPALIATGTSFIGLVYLSAESTHLWLSVVMLIVALWALPAGWRAHKQFWPGLLGCLGVVLMAFALSATGAIEAYWTVACSVAFISGHLLNRHLLIRENTQ